MSATPISRRSSVRVALLAAGVAFLALAIDGLFVEPYRLEITRHELPAAVGAPLRIAHLSDLHSRGLGRHERTLLDALEREKPDVIVITGDSVSEFAAPEKSGEVLSRLHAPLGVFLVNGNWEKWREVSKPERFYAGAGVTRLVNQSARIRDDVWIAGFEYGHSDADAALAGIPEGAYVIGLVHAPALFDTVAGRIPLLLAGHTHGGQIRIPFLPPLWLPGGSGRFVAGWYEKDGSKLYVSRGIGTSTLPIRFLCPPELALITLQPRQR